METGESSRKETDDGESMDLDGGESSEGDDSSASEEEERAEAVVEGEDLAHQVKCRQMYNHQLVSVHHLKRTPKISLIMKTDPP